MGKTASELAAFVGQHECVCIINNHISVDEVEKFLHPDGEKSEEQYPPELVLFIHDICKSHRVHPVAILLRLAQYPDALKYKKKVLYVVDRVFERQLRCKESNEVMSLKLWIILHVLREAIKFIEEKNEKDPATVVTVYCKFLLQMEPDQQVRPNLETLLRNAVRSFPYHHSLLFETLVKAIAKVPFMSRPTAYEFIVQSLFGHRILACSKFCATCGTPNADKKCPNCKFPYCSRDCQKFDWVFHKKCCDSIKGWNVQQEEQVMSIEDLQSQLGQINV
ncbi:unnamed protein product [Auanema sp. JU1783]|nr:unnamed protein product [Auanema sp. JU1783]